MVSAGKEEEKYVKMRNKVLLDNLLISFLCNEDAEEGGERDVTATLGKCGIGIVVGICFGK